MLRLLVIVGFVALIAGCAKTPDGEKIADGDERGPCYGNGTCNKGLICLSDLCVRPPPADCAAVAKKVGNLTLSNYAPRGERAEFEARVITECKNAVLTKEQGECILRAKSRGDLGDCPVKLGQGSCDRIVAHIKNVLAPKERELQQFLERGIDDIMGECEREAPTPAMESCVLAATNFAQLRACDPKRK